MEGRRVVSRRNGRMDVYKCGAIYAVIAIHVLFPGAFGEGVRAVARFAVPFFFLTAGYFSLGATRETLLRRAKRSAVQLAAACVPYLLLGLVLAVSREVNGIEWLASVFTLSALQKFLLFHTVPLPYAWQLWFLGALMTVYLLWWALTTLCETWGKPMPYDKLAVAAAVLLGVHMLFGEIFTLFGRNSDNTLLRTAALDGLPFFALGCWCGWRRRQIRALRAPWIGLMLLGAALSVAEGFIVGRQELYFGTLILLAGMMGRCIRYRRVRDCKLSRVLRFCGERLTLPIFVVHMLAVAAVREIPWLTVVETWVWFLPLLVAIVSTLLSLGLLWVKGQYQVRRTAHENH